MANVLVLLPLLASTAAQGYPRDKPDVVPQGLDTTQPTTRASPTSATPAVTYPSPSTLDSQYHGLAAMAAARAAQLAALERAKTLSHGPRDDGSYNPYKYGDYVYNYNGPFGNHLGTFLRHNNQNLIPSFQSLGNQLYYGPMDNTLGIPKGYAEARTAEMAREAQVRALQRARAEAYLYNVFPYAGFNPANYQNIFNANHTPLALPGVSEGLLGPLNRPYFGPLATPMLLASGYLADTPEVAAARAEHLTTLLKAKSLWNDIEARNNLRNGLTQLTLLNNIFRRHYQNGSSYLPLVPVGPPASLPSGYLADNPATVVARTVHQEDLARAKVQTNHGRSHNPYKRGN